MYESDRLADNEDDEKRIRKANRDAEAEDKRLKELRTRSRRPSESFRRPESTSDRMQPYYRQPERDARQTITRPPRAFGTQQGNRSTISTNNNDGAYPNSASGNAYGPTSRFRSNFGNNFGNNSGSNFGNNNNDQGGNSSSTGTGINGMQCFGCSGYGHFRRDCPNPRR